MTGEREAAEYVLLVARDAAYGLLALYLAAVLTGFVRHIWWRAR